MVTPLRLSERPTVLLSPKSNRSSGLRLFPRTGESSQYSLAASADFLIMVFFLVWRESREPHMGLPGNQHIITLLGAWEL